MDNCGRCGLLPRPAAGGVKRRARGARWACPATIELGSENVTFKAAAHPRRLQAQNIAVNRVIIRYSSFRALAKRGTCRTLQHQMGVSQTV